MIQLVFFFGFGLIIIFLLTSGEKTRRRLLYLGFFSIAVGYRSIHLGDNFYLLPFEFIILGLFLFIFSKRTDQDISLPAFLVITVIWCVFRGIISLFDGTSLDVILTWSVPLIIGLPTFWVVRRWITRVEHLSTTINILVVVSLVVSILGMIEYQFPIVERLIPGFFSSSMIISADGFVRAPFSFWGYPLVAVIITWGMLVAYYEIINPTRPNLRLFYLVFFVLCGLAVYISGQRSSWIGLVIGILLLSISKKITGGIGILIMFFVTTILPAVFWDRLNTITNFVEFGVVSDSSTAQRLVRWQWGWDTMIQNPFLGGGYGHWLVHNAYLDIGATVGVFAAITFLIFNIQLIWRIASVALGGSTPDARRYGWLFLAFAVTWVMQINVETIFQTPPIAVAFWAYMAVAWYLPDLFKKVADTELKPVIRRFSR